MSRFYKETTHTQPSNAFLVQNARAMRVLVQENEAHWEERIKQSSALELSQRKVALHELALRAAKDGQIRYDNIPRWVSEKVSTGVPIEAYEARVSERMSYGPESGRTTADVDDDTRVNRINNRALNRGKTSAPRSLSLGRSNTSSDSVSSFNDGIMSDARKL